jgi:hypothetical protein
VLQNYYAIFGPEFSYRFYSKLGTFDLVTVSMRQNGSMQSVAEQSVPERLFLNNASLKLYGPWIKNVSWEICFMDHSSLYHSSQYVGQYKSYYFIMFFNFLGIEHRFHITKKIVFNYFLR